MRSKSADCTHGASAWSDPRRGSLGNRLKRNSPDQEWLWSSPIWAIPIGKSKAIVDKLLPVVGLTTCRVQPSLCVPFWRFIMEKNVGGSFAGRVVRRARYCAIPGLAVFVASAALAATGPNCPNIKSLSQHAAVYSGASALVTADANNAVDTYTITPVAQPLTEPGVPGLIGYCVYPPQPPGQPLDGTTSYDSWVFGIKQPAGFFGWGRPNGNPTNLPFDANAQITVGTATWPLDVLGLGTAPAPGKQVILLHINDAPACLTLYGSTSGTCFVRPSNLVPDTGTSCSGGTPACKQVIITKADDGSLVDPQKVPVKTKVNIDYTYVIANSASFTQGQDMLFNVPTLKTQDVNSGGGKDYFGCEQQPAGTGVPGTFSGSGVTLPQFLTSPDGGSFKMNFQLGSGTCDQSRFFLIPESPVTLKAGHAMAFDANMTTRQNKGGKQEFTSCGEKVLNSGFTVKWFYPGNPVLQSYSTHVKPLTVTVVGCP